MQPSTTSAKTTMENRRKRSSSGEIFSFPSTPSPTQESQDSDFEFGCLTPDSPSQDPSRDSPADHLFFNGRLLPHSFPFPPRRPGTLLLSPDNISRATSRTSSVSSKDSLMSSRSNSTNSRSSSSSSARTSLSSNNSERRFLYYNRRDSCRATMASKMVTAQLYGSSQRWQHLTPVPALKREASIRQNNGGGVWIKEGSRSKRQQGGNNSDNNNKKKKVRTGDHHERPKGICRRIFMSFLFACRECHAMEPSTKDHMLNNANIKL